MKKKVQVKEITAHLDEAGIQYVFSGKSDGCITGFSSVSDYRENTVTWIKSYQKYQGLEERIRPVASRFALIIVDGETQESAGFKNALVCDNPKYVFYSILENFFDESRSRVSAPVGRHTVIEEGAEIGEGVVIGSGCYIGSQVTIGSGTRIYHNVVLNGSVEIGKNCCIKSGTVIGEEGYGYSENDGKFFHAPHFGGVAIGDDVEIGANTCIDRGSLSDTVIGEGTKIDNLCHIAHNVRIGRGVRIIAGALVAGSTVVQDRAYIAPGATVRNQLTIGEESIVGMGSTVVGDVEGHMVYVGVPAKKVRERENENL